ncbi:MAG: hypothetical protein L6Q29_03150 [Candidatus Pacebacteria bacterium]|nr:hypothetical protein [Candidatus Paceibacterota bacterium]
MGKGEKMSCECGDVVEKGNLIFSVCPDCGAVETASGWVKVLAGKKIPYGLERKPCHDCKKELPVEYYILQEKMAKKEMKKDERPTALAVIMSS